MSLEYEKGAAMRMAHNNLNFTTNGKSAQYINELVSFGPRDQEPELPTDRKNDRERETERNGDRYVPSDRRTRQKQSW